MSTPANITDEQRANLAKLAAYLRTLPPEYPDFEMNTFVQGDFGHGSHDARVPVCGTAACAAGHGPTAGIVPLKGETWSEYSVRAFCSDDKDWNWCFDAYWSKVDNTAHGAAARIEWLLANGLPDDAVDQRWGDAPLCYLPSTL